MPRCQWSYGMACPITTPQQLGCARTSWLERWVWNGMGVMMPAAPTSHQPLLVPWVLVGLLVTMSPHCQHSSCPVLQRSVAGDGFLLGAPAVTYRSFTSSLAVAFTASSFRMWLSASLKDPPTTHEEALFQVPVLHSIDERIRLPPSWWRFHATQQGPSGPTTQLQWQFY
jgi:hypothetical protein